VHAEQVMRRAQGELVPGLLRAARAPEPDVLHVIRRPAAARDAAEPLPWAPDHDAPTPFSTHEG